MITYIHSVFELPEWDTWGYVEVDGPDIIPLPVCGSLLGSVFENSAKIDELNMPGFECLRHVNDFFFVNMSCGPAMRIVVHMLSLYN
jgi:hypothetical protein